MLKVESLERPFFCLYIILYESVYYTSYLQTNRFESKLNHQRNGFTYRVVFDPRYMALRIFVPHLLREGR